MLKQRRRLAPGKIAAATAAGIVWQQEIADEKWNMETNREKRRQTGERERERERLVG